jgi:peroxiredoxin
MSQTTQMPVQPGERAPEFLVPAVQEERTISLLDYCGKTPLLLGLFPGLYCPFCRRALAQMATTSDHLKTLGVDSLAIVGTELDNARLYFKFRPTRMALGADPQLATHRLYGVPRPEPTPQLMELVENTRINPTGELPEPLPPMQAAMALTALDGYQPTPTDQRERESTFTQMKGQFLIDRDGVVRWANIECGKEGLSGLGKFPSHNELMSAASIVISGGAIKLGS